MKIIAHRGASREYPENTLPAFRRAIEVGVDEIETDLVETRDGLILLHHDETLCCGESQTVSIRQMLFAEVRKINPEIPTLQEVLEELGSQVPFCLELKTAGLAARVTELIRKYGISGQTHITSFQVNEVSEMKKLCPEAEFSWTFTRWPAGAEENLKRAEINLVSLSRENVSLMLVRNLSLHGIKTRVYTVNEVSLAQQYAAWGMEAIFTDDPSLMQPFRQH